jgi:hypothetical protein
MESFAGGLNCSRFGTPFRNGATVAQQAQQLPDKECNVAIFGFSVAASEAFIIRRGWAPFT